MRLLPVALLLLLAAPASATTSRILAPQDWWPVASPDGVHVAFTRVYPNHMELLVVNLRTHRVSHVGSSAARLDPSWSSDGARLAYSAGGILYEAAPDGTHRSRPPAPVGSRAPAWRPGSGELAYVTRGALRVGGAQWAADVLGRPAWSPDGSRLAFRRDDGVYVTTGPGRETKLFGALNPGDPSWSPDGTRVAFAVGSEVWVAGQGAAPAYAAARGRPDADRPAWSPDGGRLAFSWRAGVDVVSLPTRAVALARPSGIGVAYLPSGALAYSRPRRACPGHDAIAVRQAIVTGSCLVVGTSRADVIEGTPLWGDVIRAGAGNDRIHANDGHTDRVDCGPGRDIVWADRRDRLVHCEVVHR